MKVKQNYTSHINSRPTIQQTQRAVICRYRSAIHRWLRDLSMLAQIVDPSTAQRHWSIAQIGRSRVTCIYIGLSKICRDAGTVWQRRKTPRLATGQVCDAGTHECAYFKLK